MSNLNSFNSPFAVPETSISSLQIPVASKSCQITDPSPSKQKLFNPYSCLNWPFMIIPSSLRINRPFPNQFSTLMSTNQQLSSPLQAPFYRNSFPYSSLSNSPSCRNSHFSSSFCETNYMSFPSMKSSSNTYPSSYILQHFPWNSSISNLMFLMLPSKQNSVVLYVPVPKPSLKIKLTFLQWRSLPIYVPSISKSSLNNPYQI